MTYIQCNFCNSMVDPDLYLLQLGATRLPSNDMMNIYIDRFHIKEWMSLAPFRTPNSSFIQPEHGASMLESFLTFLATVVSTRANIGLSETELNRLEMISLLCMSDKTHSQLIELMPEKCGTSQSRDFEAILREIADYTPPISLKDTLQQGMYSPKECIWENEYDPIHAFLRSVHRRDFRLSMDRFSDYVKNVKRLKINPWPPYRDPTACLNEYDDPRLVLRSRVFHSIVITVLQKSVQWLVSEHVMSLIIYLLQQAVNIEEEYMRKNEAVHKLATASTTNHHILYQKQIDDMDLENFYKTDSLFDNLRTVINNVVLIPEPEVSPVTYSSDSDPASENSEVDTEMTDVNTDSTNVLMLQDSSWNSQYNDSIVVLPQQQEIKA